MDKNSNNTNPAAQAVFLLTTFSDARETSDNLGKVLARQFGTKLSDKTIQAQLVTSLIMLPSRIRSAIAEIPDFDWTPYDLTIAEFEKFIADEASINKSSYSFNEAINKELINKLQMISSLLDKFNPSVSIKESHLILILEKIGELIKEITEADVDSDFKHSLLSQLKDIKFDLEHYDLIGNEALVADTDKLNGAILRSSITKNGDQEKKNGFLKRAATVAFGILFVLELANNALILPESIRKALPEKPESIEQIIEPSHKKNISDTKIAQKDDHTDSQDNPG